MSKGFDNKGFRQNNQEQRIADSMSDMEPREHEGGQKTVIIATLSFIIGFGLAWLIVGNKASVVSDTVREEDESSEVTETEQTNETATVSRNDAVVVRDQTGGVRISVESVTFNGLGWVVIHEDDNGPGRILGAQLYDAGVWTNTHVDLLRGTEAGQTYYAMLHAENGDRAFDPKTDLPLKDENGDEIIMSSFKAL